MNDEELSPRIIAVGDSGVGKTSLIHRIKSGTFLDQTVPTIGAGVNPIDVEVDGKVISFQFWDTAGQEMYRNIIPIYYKGAIAAVVVFSMEDPNSFKNVDMWLHQIRENSSENIIIVIVGNKTDAIPLAISEDDAKKWAKSNGYTIFFTSAKTGQNTALITQHIATIYLANKDKMEHMESVRVDQPAENKEKKGCC
ncbi:small GTP-binding protein, putative [Trichomonas vaginalis G3]|uniref:Small GTP-binding protein, putative n=1 Tax=Trichomonas vaginalis (strain ATCC PRA-98 / G3) TaxID=412133 RepID=A2FVK0_TRIV3|nr:GTPase protein [Trichomonas vaginalis G3]EAX91077.1 small GTP-binding protein, putative [Trichomonas vaginalis G3]KAI5534185.1 GTPase protein [Trichomonas vaginalis G3]|eukprot:XP_001304007.1 small GTP-binding protein [Trichomonas vaginalis G3]